MNLTEKIQKEEAKARENGYASQGGGEWFRIVEGDNVLRVLTEPEMIFEKYKTGICYEGCGYEGTPKFLCYVMVKEVGVDGEEELVIKLAKLPYKIGKQIAEYQTDEEYSFEDWPMPYNIKIKAKNAGTKEVEYTVLASPKQTPVPSDILEELKKQKPVQEIIQKMKDKKKAEHVADGFFQAQQESDEERRARIQEEIDKRRGLKKSGDSNDDEIGPQDIPW